MGGVTVAGCKQESYKLVTNSGKRLFRRLTRLSLTLSRLLDTPTSLVATTLRYHDSPGGVLVVLYVFPMLTLRILVQQLHHPNHACGQAAEVSILCTTPIDYCTH